MNIKEACEFILFWVNKFQGAWYSPEQLCEIIDRGQMSYYNDQKPKYATSQLVREILSPFRRVYDFNTTNTVSGYIVIPSNVDYLDMLDIQIQYQISNRTVYYGVPIVAEDERADRLNSLIDPVTVTSPIAEITAPRYFRLYPVSGYTGAVTYLRRPVAPVFAYSVISERVIVYNAAASTQLEWRDTECVPLLLKALQSIGINLSDAEVAGFAQAKTESNFSGVNRM